MQDDFTTEEITEVAERMIARYNGRKQAYAIAHDHIQYGNQFSSKRGRFWAKVSKHLS